VVDFTKASGSKIKSTVTHAESTTTRQEIFSLVSSTRARKWAKEDYILLRQMKFMRACSRMTNEVGKALYIEGMERYARETLGMASWRDLMRWWRR
jgi:hypothetical protein